MLLMQSQFLVNVGGFAVRKKTGKVGGWRLEVKGQGTVGGHCIHSVNLETIQVHRLHLSMIKTAFF